MTSNKHNHTFRRAALTLLALIMACATAWAQTIQSVTYIDENGQTQTVNATQITSDNLRMGSDRWYYVSGVVGTDYNTLSLYLLTENGTHNLILCDGATLTVSQVSQYSDKYAKLKVYGQSGGTGKLNVGNSSMMNAISNCDFALYGGEVTLTYYSNGHGINKNVDFNGGKLTATSGANAIGGNTTINATSGWIKASKYGGSVTIAEGKYMKDETGRCYKGTLTDAEKAAAAGKTLQPATQTEYISYIFGGGNGLQNSPYVISSTEGWNFFCDCLDDNNTWNRFSGKTVKLGADISVTRMAGSSQHDFCGTFDGNHKTLTFTSTENVDGVAPFSYISETTPTGGSEVSHPAIRNLNVVVNIDTTATHASGLVGRQWGTLTIEDCTVSGTITTSAKYAAGFIGQMNGSANITDCLSSVTINSSVEGDGTHGGFVAETSHNTLNIEGCVFNGSLLGESTHSCGGFIGWRNSTVNISNSLFAPAEVTIGVGTDYPSATFVRNGATATITNCYYTDAFGTVQGKLRHSITAGANTTVANAGTATTYNVSGITSYGTGILYGGVLYAGNGDAVSLTLAHQELEGYDFIGYTATAGNLNGSTLTMPDGNVTINAEYNYTAPSELTATDITFTTATLNWNGLQESYNVRYQPAILYEGFESGTMPDGWTRTGAYWQITSGTGSDDYTGAATGNYNAGCYIPLSNVSDTLITPVMDLSNVASATLSFNFWNTDWGGDINILKVYYRVDEGEWQSLYTYENATAGWIPVTINLEGMAANYQIGFECEIHYSFGMGIDDVKVIDNGTWTTETNVLNPFTLTGLTPGTPYVWQVQGLDCDGEGSTTEWSESGTFTTLNPCETPYNLTATDITATTSTLNWNGLQESYSVRYRPVILYEGFESGTMPDGWTRTGAYWQVTSGTGSDDYTGAATGNYNAGCYIVDQDVSDTLITPVMDLGNVASATLSFNFWNTVDYGAINILNVYYRVDEGEWQSLYTYEDATGGWIPVTINLEGMAANYQIGFECEGYSFGMGIDDVMVTGINTSEWTTVTNVSSPHDLTGLTPETPYVWQVQGSNCDGEGSTTEWSEEGIFTTPNPCETPYNLTATDITATTATLNWNGLQESYNVRCQPAILNEGFESGTMPDGWTKTGAYWQVTSGTGYNDYTGAATGNYNAGCYINYYNDSDTLITPVMDLGNLASATLSFNFWNTDWNVDINTLKVYYRVDEGEWHLLYTNSNATGGWIPVTINLEGMAAHYQIGFECESHYSFGMGIDDVKVIDNGAWTTENNVLYPFTLTGLTPETQYLWQVQGLDCDGEGSTTEWSEAGTFTTLAGIDLTVAGYEEGNGGWVFIASPVAGSIAPSEVHNLFPSAGETSNEYDLYRFDQRDANGNEWQNWKATTEQNHPDFTGLVNGQGYLYATKETRTLMFAGEFRATTEPVEVPLDYDENAEFAGWNLVGNPFAVGATSSQPYYRMNEGGTALSAQVEAGNTVEAMEGVFVQATAANQTVTFTTQTRGGEKATIAQANIMVVGDNGAVIDNAIIRFDGGQTLEKFSFREGSTKIYIPQDGKDYAIVSVGRDGVHTVSTGVNEIPVNFKANENGTYTISVDVDNVELAYLHLIDNMTGADVDLLAANGGDARHGDADAMKCKFDGVNRVSTYTFTAKTTDYESRFKLVFSICEDANGDNAPFAFISNGNLIVNGEGTLQVFDVLGHQLVTKQLSTLNSQLSTLNYKSGVYMLRLINGDKVRTQKIVVE
ncbi:MAG: T9SS type A sorting domain-containing protein [Bacteroidales bacterium]|nr:T9SS type A sorting domain-containing protein [Bacteroidales bacterium]